MKDFFEIIYAIGMLIVLIGKIIIVFFGLFVFPYYIWKHYDDQKKRSAKMAFMAKKLGLQFEQARNSRMDNVHRFLTLERVVELRNACVADHGSVSHQEGTEKQFVAAIQKLLAVAEAYPDLKSDKSFLELQRELVNTEDRIQAARRFYNGNVRNYRNRCESFPSNILANLFNFESREFFNVDPAVRVAPSIAGAL